jgi:hypothetical protein
LRTLALRVDRQQVHGGCIQSDWTRAYQ